MNIFADSGSINDSIVEEVDYSKDKVIAYLSNQNRIASCPKEAIDCVTGEIISQSFSVYSDGEYDWCDFLIYHIKKYNIKLPKGLIKKV